MTPAAPEPSPAEAAAHRDALIDQRFTTATWCVYHLAILYNTTPSRVMQALSASVVSDEAWRSTVRDSSADEVARTFLRAGV